MSEQDEKFSLKNYFVPLTTLKAIHWIVIIGLIVYFNSLFNGFVGDDNGQIVNNTAIHSLVNIPSFFRMSTFNLGNGISGLYYKPILLTIYSLIYSLSGLTPFAFHIVQVSLSIANAILVFVLFKKFLKQEIAFVLSLVFLVHPINQDAAAYISNMQDTTFLFFGMLGLLFSTAKESKYLDLKVYICLTLSLLCKETGLLFFFINLVYLCLFRKEKFKKAVIFSTTILIIYAFVHTLTVGTNFVSHHDYHIGRIPLIERLINIPKIIFYYLYTFIFPKDLAVNYDWVVKSLTFWDFFFPLLIDLSLFTALITLCIFLKRKTIRYKYFIFFSLWFIIGLSLHIQIIPLDGTVSLRWFYLSSIGLLGIFGILLQTIIKEHKRSKQIFVGCSVIILVLFSLRTIVRNTNFKDNLTLMCHDAKVSQNNFSLENSCGVSLLAIGEYNDAQKHLEKSVTLAPYYGTNWWGYGATLGKKAELQHNKRLLEQSVAAFKKGVEIEPTIPWSYESLGYVYAHYYDTKRAKEFLENSLKKFPHDYTLWLNYGYVEYKLGNKAAALNAMKNAYTLNPNDSEVAQDYYNLINDIPIKIQPTTL